MTLDQQQFIHADPSKDPGTGVGVSIELRDLDEIRGDADDGAKRDLQDMERMGKQQLFRRDFKLFPSFAFVILVQLTWVCLLTSNSEGLIDGGRAGTLWSTIWTFLGFLPVIASLSEMASWAPTSGGQYHWVSE